MSGQLVDLVVVVVGLAILVYFVFIQPAARRAERTARLSALAAVLDGGHLQAGHIHGSHGMSRLGCTLQAHGGLGPTPPMFAEQLEILVRIVRINAQVNRAPEAHQVAVPPARTNNHDLARAVLGAWSNQLLAMTFEADGTLSMVMKLGRHKQTGRWALDGDGRVQLSGEEGLRATAWVEGQALTVLLPRGMTVRLQRG